MSEYQNDVFYLFIVAVFFAGLLVAALIGEVIIVFLDRKNNKGVL